MLRLLRQFKRALTVVALLGFLLGTQAHLGLLQMTAWSSMLLSRAPDQGIEQAIESTFSGEEPCCLCKVVAEQSEQPEPDEAPQLPFRSELKLTTAEFPTTLCRSDSLETSQESFGFPGSSAAPDSFIGGIIPPPPKA